MSEKNEKEGRTGGGEGGASLWLGIGIINRSVCNLGQVGGGSNPYGLVGISTPASPRTLYGFYTLQGSQALVQVTALINI